MSSGDNMVGDDANVEVTEEFVASVMHWSTKRAKDAGYGDTDTLAAGIEILVRSIILETVHQLSQDAVCFAHDHQPSPIAPDEQQAPEQQHPVHRAQLDEGELLDLEQLDRR